MNACLRTIKESRGASIIEESSLYNIEENRRSYNKSFHITEANEFQNLIENLSPPSPSLLSTIIQLLEMLKNSPSLKQESSGIMIQLKDIFD